MQIDLRIGKCAFGCSRVRSRPDPDPDRGVFIFGSQRFAKISLANSAVFKSILCLVYTIVLYTHIARSHWPTPSSN